MTIARAFIVRDFRVAWSYRLSFLVQNASVLFSLLSLKFVARMFDAGGSTALQPFGGDYFAFALVGVALSVMAYPVVKAFAGAVRSAQVTGTLEAMLTTHAGPTKVVLCSGIYPIMAACAQVVLTVALGAVVFGAGIHAGHIGLALLVLVLSIAALAGIGLLSAAFTLVFKQGEPFSGAFIAASFMVSGILYPTSVQPGWIRVFAPMLPLTHSVALARGLLLADADAAALAGHFLALSGFALLLPVGALVLSRAITIARRSGSLAQY